MASEVPEKNDKLKTTIRRTKNILTSILALLPFSARRHSERALFIETYAFPSSVHDKLSETHPELGTADIALVQRGLRDWFQVCLNTHGRFVSMPSRIVDDAWHAFILDTDAYERFCRQAFGRFLHHRPAQPFDTPTQARDGLERAWKHAARLTGQDPYDLLALPLLFGIDAQLAVKNGLHYSRDWLQRSRAQWSGGLFRSCGSGGGGGSSSCSSPSCGSTCGSSCGGGGCGGGS